MGQLDDDILGYFWRVRAYTEGLCQHLSAEDQCIQSMPDASPVKWHRAHTTWFFEQFLLLSHQDGYHPFNPDFNFLFNSYYEALGERQPRFARGMITRPTADMVGDYRRFVDAALARLLQDNPTIQPLVELGLQHEQQHQELLVTDCLHAFSQNPIRHAVLPGWNPPAPDTSVAEPIAFDEQVSSIGHTGPAFAFDNETPRHRVLLSSYRIASHLVRNREWLEFITDGGYSTPTLWMADGWAAVQQNGWKFPSYWRRDDQGWLAFGPGGEFAVDLDAPVRHISWYEADAFARWSEARLPTEAEWEHASTHPKFREKNEHVWQWTGSSYLPYPGFKAVAGAVGEYNGKFMVNQMVLRGGSAVTSPGHTRDTYRNFFYPDKRWQFTGLRLAWDGV